MDFPIHVKHIRLSKGKRPGTKITPNGVTVHSNANLKSTDTGEVANLNRADNERNASFHFAVDEDSATEAIPWRPGVCERANHATDGNGPGNTTQIAVEICEGGDRKKTLRNASILIAYILHTYGWTIEDVSQHNRWYNKKNCPRILRENPRQWPEFLSMIQAELNSLKTGAVKMNKPSDWAKVAWEKAQKKKGKDGKPIMDGTNPQGTLTREQLATVLDRLGLLD